MLAWWIWPIALCMATFALGILVAGFLACALESLPAHVPMDRLTQLLSLPLAQFLNAAQAPPGWAWLASGLLPGAH